jgi:hypothetical protein
MTNERFTPRVVSVSRTIAAAHAAADDPETRGTPSPYVRRNLIVLAERCHVRMTALVEQALRHRGPFAASDEKETR